MDYKELFERYQSLLIENSNLKVEIKSLKVQLGIKECQADCDVVLNQEVLIESINQNPVEEERVDDLVLVEINNMSEPHEKIKLYMSLFKGREDVYAKRWVSPKKGTAGYSPFCMNEWKYSMTKRHEIPFKSYDRLFPNQDTMPKGGFGNLIALPLQKAARNDKNSVFIDEYFEPIEDQWVFLSSIKKLSEDELETYTYKLCSGNELGTLKKDDEGQKPELTVRMLEKMYNKRLTGYASIGYKAKGEIDRIDSVDVIFDKSNFLPVYSNDIMSAEREIIIVSPFVTKKRSLQMLKTIEVALENKVKVIVVTRPVEDFQGKDMATLHGTLNLLKSEGVIVVFKSNIHQKFAVMDQKIVWYGSINLLSFGNAEESIMRLESHNIANELIKSIEKE